MNKLSSLLSGEDAGRRQIAWLAVSIAVLVVLFFHRAVFSDQIFISRDIQLVYYPLYKYWVDRISHWEFPDWFPYEGLGQPFVGMVISGAFHPSKLLYLLLPLGAALKLNVLICYPVAGAGTYLFARRWRLAPLPSFLAAILYTFNGYLVSINNNVLYLMAAASFPWALWAADRFYQAITPWKATVAAGLLALVLLTGDAQGFVICSAACGALALARYGPGLRAALAAATVLALSALFGAAQIIPAATAFSEGVPGHQSLQVALLWSMHPLRLLELFLGPIFGGEPISMTSRAINLGLLKTGFDSLWAESVHFGVVGAALAGAALVFHRRRAFTWWMVGLALGLLLLALGKFTHLYAVLFDWLPLWRGFRYPEKLLPYLLFLLSLGAAIGLQRLLSAERARKSMAVSTAALAVLAFGLFLAEKRFQFFSHRLVPTLWDGQPPQAALARLHDSFLRVAVQAAVTALLASLIFALARNAERLALLISLLCFGNLIVANEPLYELTFPDVLSTPTAFVEAIRAREGSHRLGGYRVFGALEEHTLPPLPHLTVSDRYAISVGTALLPAFPSIWGLESANGYLPARSRRLQQLEEHGLIWISGLFGVRYLSIPPELFHKLHGNPARVIAQHPQLQLLLLETAAAPRASLKRPRCAASQEAALHLILARQFAVDREAVVECPIPLADRVSRNRMSSLDPVPASGPSDDSVPLGTVEVVSYLPERVELNAHARSEAVLVLNDALYRGWQAFIDGKRAEILAANYAVRGVMVTPGDHHVVFVYRTPGLVWGCTITLATLLGALVASAGFRRFWAPKVAKNVTHPA